MSRRSVPLSTVGDLLDAAISLYNHGRNGQLLDGSKKTGDSDAIIHVGNRFLRVAAEVSDRLGRNHNLHEVLEDKS